MQHKQYLTFAYQYADSKHLEMVVINLLVRFEQPLYPKLLSPGLLKQHDVLNMLRADKDLIAEVAAYWEVWVIEGEGAHAEVHYDWK